MSTKQAREAEAKSDAAEVNWRGHKFEVPRNYDDWTVDLVESLEEGKAVGIVRGALGPRQWADVKRMEPKMRDIGDLADKIAEALGFSSAGESAASSD